MCPSILIQNWSKRRRKVWTKGTERHKRRWIIQHTPLLDSFVILYNGRLENNRLIAWKRSPFCATPRANVMWKCHYLVASISSVSRKGQQGRWVGGSARCAPWRPRAVGAVLPQMMLFTVLTVVFIYSRPSYLLLVKHLRLTASAWLLITLILIRISGANRVRWIGGCVRAGCNSSQA